MAGLLKDVIDNLNNVRTILIPVYKNFHWHLLQFDFVHEGVYDFNSLLLRKNDGECERFVSFTIQSLYRIIEFNVV